LDKIETAMDDARGGAFDPSRIVLSYHGEEVEGHRQAYQISKKMGVHHLLFNPVFYSEEYPNSNSNPEAMHDKEFVDLCETIKSENKITSYYTEPYKNRPNFCSFTSNAFTIGPNNTISPCCQVTPVDHYGTLDNPEPLMDFTDRFIEGEVPDMCKTCSTLGMKHF